MVVLWDGPEDNSVVGALRKQVLCNDVNAMLLTLNTLRDEHRHQFNCRDSKNRTALLASCERQVSPEIMRILLQPENQMYGGRPNDQASTMETALMECVRKNAVNKAIMLLECGASVTLRGYLNLCPLEMAESIEMATVLFKYGAEASMDEIDFDGDDTVGMTALSDCISDEDIPRAELFMQHGVDMSTSHPETPYTHIAIKSQGTGSGFTDNKTHIDMLQYVLEKGADITSIDSMGRSARDVADCMEHRYAVRLIDLIMDELPIETSRWNPENIDPIYQALSMSQHRRPGLRYGMCRIPGEVLQKVIQHLKASYPTNMVAAAMSSIKERHNGRFPIRQ